MKHKQAYYKRLFRGYELVTILKVEKYMDFSCSYPSFTYKCLIRLKNGKIKLVESEKLIIIENTEESTNEQIREI